MSDAVIIALIVCVTLVLLALLAFGWATTRSRQQRAERLWEPRTDKYWDAPAQEPQGALVEPEAVQQPVPFDPENPPTWRIYNPRPGAPRRSCNCHDEPLSDGQEVLWWPQPNSPAVMLFCRRAVPTS